MKRIILLFLSVCLLTGCGSGRERSDQMLDLRSRVLSSDQIGFRAEITADYIDAVEEFSMFCQVDGEGTVSFRVEEPEEISGITGKLSGQEGALIFDEEMLAFGLMADEQLSPISGPWVMVKALRTGVITAAVQEDEKLHVTINDSYGEQPFTTELWIEDRKVEEAEISWQGRRFLSMDIEDFEIM